MNKSKKKGRLCSLDGCSKKHFARTYCAMHYHRQRKYGTPHVGRSRTQNRHGYAKRGARTREYASWTAMWQRCINPKAFGFYRYGGRGISVCQRWGHFEVFLQDMGSRPPDTSLDRIDNDGNYEPSNCRWATRKRQQRNRKNCAPITVNGETKFISQWAKISPCAERTIRDRLTRGWSPEHAVFWPQHATSKWLSYTDVMEKGK